jgi:hypothetical protein
VTATNQSPPQYPPADADTSGEPVTLFVINGTRTSDGPGPGVKHLPRAEAGALVAAHLAVHGEKPPQGWTG